MQAEQEAAKKASDEAAAKQKAEAEAAAKRLADEEAAAKAKVCKHQAVCLHVMACSASALDRHACLLSEHAATCVARFTQHGRATPVGARHPLWIARRLRIILQAARHAT